MKWGTEYESAWGGDGWQCGGDDVGCGEVAQLRCVGGEAGGRGTGVVGRAHEAAAAGAWRGRMSA